jgi:hypothetical protein
MSLLTYSGRAFIAICHLPFINIPLLLVLVKDAKWQEVVFLLHFTDDLTIHRRKL